MISRRQLFVRLFGVAAAAVVAPKVAIPWSNLRTGAVLSHEAFDGVSPQMRIDFLASHPHITVWPGIHRGGLAITSTSEGDIL